MTRRQHRPALSVAFAMLATALASCEVGGHAESYSTVRIRSAILTEPRQPTDPYLSSRLSTDLSLVISEVDAETLGVPSTATYGPLVHSADGTSSLSVELESETQVASDGFRFCLTEDVLVRDNSTNQDLELVPAGTCTDRPTLRWDAMAKFAEPSE